MNACEAIILRTEETDAAPPTAQTLCAFLAEYASELFSSGATCIRMERNVRRIAAAYGKSAEIAIFPRHLHITVSEPDSIEVVTSIVAMREAPISFQINTQLSRLSWDVADSNLTFGHMVREFQQILRSPGTPRWLVLLLASLANASFCRLFGGDFVAMTVVAIATFAGLSLKQMLTEKKTDFRLTVMICAFVSSILAAADTLFSLGTTPDITIGTSVLYLVPGIPFINSFCDMLDRHYICAFGRLMNAIVITACLSAGLCLGMFAMNVGMF